jgi:quercetin dioxygenase-like cupin family protein
MIMSKMKVKLLLAGVVVGCAFGLIALRFAWATPPSGPNSSGEPTFSSSFIAGPVTLDALDIQSETDSYEIEIKTNGASQARVAEIRIAPGGHTGWHSHPGPVFVMITAGALTLEQADGSIAVYPAGTGFVEEPGHVNIARNEEDVDLELVAFFLTPFGAAPRTDEPAP